MIKKVTTKWLKSWDACESGVEWFESQKETDPVKLLKKLVRLKKYQDANYSIVRLFNRKQRIQYAVFAAEQVIDIYEKENPGDDRPRKAIEAAKKCINRNTEKNRAAATYAAAYAATYAAAYAATYAAAYAATYAAAYAATYAADAAYAAYAAAYAAYAAAYAAATYAAYAAATYAAYAAADAAYASAAMQKKILNYGIKLLEVKQ